MTVSDKKVAFTTAAEKTIEIYDMHHGHVLSTRPERSQADGNQK